LLLQNYGGSPRHFKGVRGPVSEQKVRDCGCCGGGVRVLRVVPAGRELDPAHIRQVVCQYGLTSPRHDAVAVSADE